VYGTAAATCQSSDSNSGDPDDMDASNVNSIRHTARMHSSFEQRDIMCHPINARKKDTALWASLLQSLFGRSVSEATITEAGDDPTDATAKEPDPEGCQVDEEIMIIHFCSSNFH